MSTERTDTDERAARIAAIEARVELLRGVTFDDFEEVADIAKSLETERARVLALLRTGYFGKALDVMEGKEE